LIQTSALDAVQGALGDGGGRRRGRTGAAPSRQGTVRGGGKRDPEVIAALTDELLAFIAKNPGKRIEEISAALETPTRDLVLPVRRLVAGKRVSTRGQKRATTYFPGSARSAGAKKKAGRPSGRSAKTRTQRAAPKTRGRPAGKRRRGGGASDAAAENGAEGAGAAAETE